MNLSSLPARRNFLRDFISVHSFVFLGETIRNQTGRTFSCRLNCQSRDRPFLHWHSFNKLRNWRNCQFITNSMEQGVSWKVNTRPDYRRVHKILRLALSSIRWIQSTPALRLLKPAFWNISQHGLCFQSGPFLLDLLTKMFLKPLLFV
jgi:hypothetical protein